MSERGTATIERCNQPCDFSSSQHATEM